MRHKWYVVDVQTICIDSEWDSYEKAFARATQLSKEGGVPELHRAMPRVGRLALDPQDPRSWHPRRNGDLKKNPASVVRTARDERLWEMAKESAAAQGREDDWAYIMGIFKRMKARIGGAQENPESMRENPDTSRANPDTSRAEAVFEMWHKKNPRRVSTMRLGCDSDENMVCVGRAYDITYRSGKWEKGRKTNDYVHTFDSKPKVWMLKNVAEGRLPGGEQKTVGKLLSGLCNEHGQYEVADLAAPLSFTLDDGKEGTEIAIHGGSRVYGGVDCKTLVIVDPHWQLIVVKGGKMYFDERGIVY